MAAAYLVVTGQSLLPSVGFLAAENLAPMDWLVGVAFGVAFEVLLPGEGLVAVLALVHPLYLDPPAAHLYVFLRSVKCHNLSRETVRESKTTNTTSKPVHSPRCRVCSW